MRLTSSKKPVQDMRKVTYFGIYGKAEPIRVLLARAKVTFEDERLDKGTFGAKKAGRVPIRLSTYVN